MSIEDQARGGNRGPAPRLVLHVGAPKCGSTSIQKALSDALEFQGAGARYVYCRLGKTGRVISGERLQNFARNTAAGVATSSGLRSQEPKDVLDPAVEPLAGLVDAGCTPVLSSEAWLQRSRAFTDRRFVEKLGGGAHVVIMVRPPVDWINSAWWQWGVWTDTDFSTYFDKEFSVPQWSRFVRDWADVPGVEKVSVRPIGRDAVGRFFAALGAETPASGSLNTGLPGSFLYFMTRNRRFRPDPHAPQTEFIIESALPPGRKTAPWMMTRDSVARALEGYEDEVKALAPYMDEAGRRELAEDPRWSDPAAYRDRTTDDPASYTTPEALGALARDLAAALGSSPDRAERQIRDAMRGKSGEAAIAAADEVIARLADQIITRARRMAYARRLKRWVKRSPLVTAIRGKPA